MRITAVLCLCTGLAIGCGTVSTDNPSFDESEQKAGILQTGGDAVQMGLAELSGELPEVGYRQLLDRGAVVEQGITTGTSELSASLRRALLAVASYRTDRVDDAVVRVQRFRINQAFPALRLLGREIHAVLPFRLRVGGSIEFARIFASEIEANAADRFKLTDYPHDIDSVLALPEGTVVTIPVETSVSFDVGGAFLHRSARRGGQVLQPLRASVIGSTSAVRQGTLVGSGSFRLQMIRLEAQKVRVRLISAGGHDIGGRFSASLWTSARYAFLPAAHLDRIRSFRRHLETASTVVDQVRSADERIRSLRTNLPNAVRGVLDASPIEVGDRVGDLVDRALKVTDRALENAQSFTTDLESLDQAVGERVDQVLKTSTSFWDQRIQPVSARIRRLSSRVYAFDQSITLNDRLKRQLRLLSDYVFDLSSEDAQIALLRAISGRAVWRGMTQAITQWDTESTTFADFTLADDLATEDRGLLQPRVQRLAQGGSDLRTRSYNLSLKALGMSIGLDGSFEQNRVTMTDEGGDQSIWHTRAWERGQRTRIFGNARAETFASGAFTNAVNDDLTDGGYWLRWKKTYGDRAQKPVSNAFAHILNDLGPIAVEMGIPKLYFGEFPGKVSAEFFVAVNPDAMAALFDESETPDTLLWTVLGEMMSRYERPFSLPYAHAPIRPRALREIEGASAACEAVAARIGGRYCYSFLDRIFPALRAAQEAETPEARVEFFESFYRVPAGGSVLSTRVLVRYLAELFYAMGIEDPLTVQIRIQNADDDSDAASPTFLIGDPARLSLGETTVLNGLIE